MADAPLADGASARRAAEPGAADDTDERVASDGHGADEALLEESEPEITLRGSLRWQWNSCGDPRALAPPLLG